MARLSDRAQHEIEMHRAVAHMYRRRSAWDFAEDFQQERNAALISLLPPGKGGHALDLGCGTGVMLDLMSSRCDSVIGLDLSMEMLEGFDLSTLPQDRKVHLARADMQQLPLQESQFDVVVCRSALHHMEDEGVVLSEIARVMAPEGRLVLGEPANDNLLTRLARWWVKRRPSYGTIHTIDRAYTRRQLRQLLDEAGLTVDREIRFGFLAYPLCDNPELVPVLTWLPFSRFIGKALRAMDRILSKIPLVRSQSWYTMLSVKRQTS